jgi:hypothetical protein
MGKYRNGRRVAVQGGRLLMEKVENLVKGGAIPKPVWFEAMKMCPPPTLPFRCGCCCLHRSILYSLLHCEFLCGVLMCLSPRSRQRAAPQGDSVSRG